MARGNCVLEGLTTGKALERYRCFGRQPLKNEEIFRDNTEQAHLIVCGFTPEAQVSTIGELGPRDFVQ